MTSRYRWAIATMTVGVTIVTACSSKSPDDSVSISIDATNAGEQVSPFIRGVSGGLSTEQMRDAGIRLRSWGGNPSTRYNYLIGHAWNHGADFEFRNVNYGDASGDVYAGVAAENADAGAETRLAVPTLGWVAKDGDPEHCSFPDGEGGCAPASEELTCERGDRVADPRLTSVESTPAMVADWIGRLVADGLDPRFIAMDNEPELWGHTHYDVHPSCTTFEEVLDTYVTYARAIRAVDPDAELLGPVTCCWFDYMDPKVEPADGSDTDFVTWFLQHVRAADEEFGQRTLDMLDVHYYPQSGVFNDDDDATTNARRLRSTRALWDESYTDESWIDRPIAFIPRMRELADVAYPGTRLAISEWNFGADDTINGALAVADVLGIYGREGVYLAAYWFAPDVDSPGYFAFKMHGNYDGAGSAFEGAVVPAESSEAEIVSSYAVLDERADVLRVMLINKEPDIDVRADIEVSGFEHGSVADRFTYGRADPAQIRHDTVTWTGAMVVPAYSIVVLELAEPS
jgi:hypothetical protein